MSKINILLDRELLDSAHIQSRQNFDLILQDFRSVKQPLGTRAWFYGAVGTASVAFGVSVINLDPITKAKVETTDPPVIISHFAPPHQQKKPQETLEKPQETPGIQRIEKEESSKTNPPITQTQVPVVQNEKVAKRALLPSIGGIFDGQISVAKFCETGSIECNHADFLIRSFVFEGFVGSEDIRREVLGAKLPDDICQSIKDLKRKESVFITEIRAGKNGEEGSVTLPSLHLELIPE